MTDVNTTEPVDRQYWLTGKLKQIGTGLTGVIAVFMALKLAGHDTGGVITMSDHILRMVAYCSLTIWITLSVGLNRRGFAAILVLGFASVCELFLLPARVDSVGTLASANLGIVLAYCGLQLYVWSVTPAEATDPAA
ncbi:MAG: hypothetical protein ACRBEQ_08510 [Hyphomonas sp.]